MVIKVKFFIAMQSYSKQMLKLERSIYEVVIMEYQIPVIYLLLNFLLMFKNSKKVLFFHTSLIFSEYGLRVHTPP